jgi:hypothetical protein
VHRIRAAVWYRDGDTRRLRNVPSRTLSEEQVREVIAEVWRRAPREHDIDWRTLDVDVPLYGLEAGEESLGLDSFDAVEIATELEEAFDVVLPAELDPSDLRTLRSLVEMLSRVHAEQHGGGAA